MIKNFNLKNNNDNEILHYYDKNKLIFFQNEEYDYINDSKIYFDSI